MNKLLYALLLLIELALVSSKVISTNDLKGALSQVNPGDIIELQSGLYEDIPYYLKGGTSGNPIKIKSAPGATVIFSGNEKNCIFFAKGISYLTIEGPMEFEDSRCGVEILNGKYINITGLDIHDMKDFGLIISGHNNIIYNNTIQACVQRNSYYHESTYSGWDPCLAVHEASDLGISTNIIIEKNIIRYGYGEGIKIFKCDGCKIINNNITNTYNVSLFIEASKNIIIDKNIIKVTNDKYNSRYGKACGIVLKPQNGRYLIEDVIITNNIIISTNGGIFYFSERDEGGYDNIKILHNTLWKVSYSPIIFTYPINVPSDCEMKNNFIYYDKEVKFIPKSSWSLGYNYYYNTYTVPSIYSDTTSKAAKKLDISTIFNKLPGCEEYNYNHDANIDIQCFHPSKTPSDFNLYHTGIAPKTKVNDDYSNCERSPSTPSIGAFEYPIGCSEGGEPDENKYDVKFKINVCTSGSQVVKMIGSFCSWEAGGCPAMKDEGNCNWSYTIREGTSLSFSYKFAIVLGSSISKIESDPNRRFDGYSLASLAEYSTDGKYESCSFVKSGNIITLFCAWRT